MSAFLDESYTTVSSRAQRLIKPPLPYILALIQYLDNQYDPDRNPSGKVLMAVAENKLCFDMLKDRVLAACCESALRDSTMVLNYTSSTGIPSLKKALSDFLAQYIFAGQAVDPGHLVVSSGCVATLVTLSLLLFEPDDSVLIPTPYYPAFDADFSNFGHVSVQPVRCEHPDENNPFGYITPEALAAAYEEARSRHQPPKALLLSNPVNPTGRLLTPAELQGALDFSRSHKLHLVMDEIYALSVFNGGSFTSVVRMLDGQLGDYVHWVWSFSKDFGASGLRTGVLYTQNKSLLAAVNSTNDAMMVSNLTQLAFQTVIRDDAFVASYIVTNAQRLQGSYKVLSELLTALSVRVLPAQGGIFAFVSFATVCKIASYEEEKAFFEHMLSHGVLLTPGQSCHCPLPGYFRVCYAFVTELAMREGVRRIGSAIATFRS
ncbi:aminotransferase class I/II-fold pyridoxal phosphate-dependent enzyme [archaeon]|nr:MAG: aminotransferase class I/II-fold pyridoxal phosphate-dependent enzyme [archaeon]